MTLANTMSEVRVPSGLDPAGDCSEGFAGFEIELLDGKLVRLMVGDRRCANRNGNSDVYTGLILKRGDLSEFSRLGFVGSSSAQWNHSRKH